MRKALIIASEVRSGSTFVAESIAYHFAGIFGDVLFGLTKENFAHLNETSSHAEILTRFNSLYLGHQGWVASKIMCAALSIIAREARKAESLRETLFGSHVHWIIVRRRMKVRQAVSLAYARKTGDWHVYGTERTDAHGPGVTLGETQDALRAVLLSDIHLETFENLIASDRRIEVFYEDFLSDPLPLIEHVYDVLGLARPDGGVKYVDRTKILQVAAGPKRETENAFNAWLVENYHPVEKPRVPESITKEASTQSATAEKAEEDFRLTIVLEFTKKKRSMQSLAKKYGVDRSLISYWVAKHKHGELNPRSTTAEELSFFAGKVATLEREIEELKRRLANGTPLDGHTEVSGQSAS